MAQRSTRSNVSPPGRVDTRTRLVLAAREQLLDPRGLVAFTVDAIARRAHVSRQTVYNQFGSKAGLLEAVCDHAAATSGLTDLLPEAFSQPNPEHALARFIEAFGLFWSVDRDLTRRMLGLAQLEPEYAAVLEARDQRRISGLGVLVDRFAAPPGFADSTGRRELLRTLQTLTAFASFDAIAGPDRDAKHAASTITFLARAAISAIGLKPARPRASRPRKREGS